MIFYRPHSFFTLLLTGFFFVSLLLLMALFSSVKILDGLMLQSIVAVYHSVDMVNSSRKVAELLQDEERKARVYHVLSEPAQLNDLNNTHHDFEKNLEYLIPFNSDEKLELLLEELKFKKNYIIDVLNTVTGDPEEKKQEQEKVLALYQDLSSLAISIVKWSNKAGGELRVVSC